MCLEFGGDKVGSLIYNSMDCVQSMANWTCPNDVERSDSLNDFDGDGCKDGVEDWDL